MLFIHVIIDNTPPNETDLLKMLDYKLKRDQNLSIQKLHLSDIHRFRSWPWIGERSANEMKNSLRLSREPWSWPNLFSFHFFIGRSLTDSRSTSRMLNRWMSLKCNFWILRFWSCFSSPCTREGIEFRPPNLKLFDV